MILTLSVSKLFIFFFLKNPPPPEIYTLPLPAALPICPAEEIVGAEHVAAVGDQPVANVRAEESGAAGDEDAFMIGDFFHRASVCIGEYWAPRFEPRSEEHTSELQSPCNLVCRLLLEKK